MTHNKDNAGVAVHPPLLFLGGLAIACAVEGVAPLWGGLLNAPTQALIIGAAAVLCAIALLAACFVSFTRAGTNVPTNRPSTAIVSSGPYSFSRNPIYIALMAFYGGLCLLLNAPWGLIVLPVLFAVLLFGVVQREEVYLAAKFPREYADYCARVRRWL